MFLFSQARMPESGQEGFDGTAVKKEARSAAASRCCVYSPA
jgi:hypothetical protein